MADIHATPSQRVGSMAIIERDYYGSHDELVHEDDKGVPLEPLRREDTFQGLTEPERPKPVLPAGVRQMDAITQVWTKKWLVTAYLLITVISFTNSLQQQTNFQFIPFVTSSFSHHSLTAMTGLVASVVGGVSKLPLATFINVCGRPHGFAMCLLFVILGLIMFSTCKNVETYAAAQVFYWVGMNGMGYVLDIFIADTSLMKNRLIWIAITMSPYVCNAFAGPALAMRILNEMTWRWGYGMFAIITPIMCIPFWIMFWMLNRKTKRMGTIPSRQSGRKLHQSVLFWCREFDVIGLILVCAGFCCVLMPIGLATASQDRWKAPAVTILLVIGILCLLAFGLWEYFWASKTFFPFHLLKDRSVVGACMLGFNGWITFYSYRMYYTSYLQVVYFLPVSTSGYITNIFSIVSCTFAVIISIAFRYTDTYRWAAFLAMPLQLLSSGLLIHFRKPETHIGLLAMVEVLYAIGGAIMVQVEQIAVMTAVPHEHLATGLALLAMITALGGAVGQAISSAVWNGLVLRKLTTKLPEDRRNEAKPIFDSLVTQLAYAKGSVERDALIAAYADAQKVMVIVGVCSLVPCLLWISLLRNNRLSAFRSGKGLQA